VSFSTVARIVVHISICSDFGFGIFYDIGLSTEAGSCRIGPASGFFFGFALGLGGIGAALLGNWPASLPSTLCLSHLLGPPGGRPPDCLPAKSEPVSNRCDMLIARSLCSGIDRVVRLALAAVIHFFSIDVTRSLRL
jgi:hypothetical protein